jgi:hypothetical protein
MGFHSPTDSFCSELILFRRVTFFFPHLWWGSILLGIIRSSGPYLVTFFFFLFLFFFFQTLCLTEMNNAVNVLLDIDLKLCRRHP